MRNPEVIKMLYRHDFKAFSRFAHRELEPNKPLQEHWYGDVIVDRVESCLKGEMTRLIVNAPPDILSSLTVSVVSAAWAIGRDPTLKILLISHRAKRQRTLNHARGR